ncbi:MAG: hypothetical protein J5I93_04920, partial [Pirellulaceae bacterium]|nr:hypothetical protein [Pirellulaceae bacterium]
VDGTAAATRPPTDAPEEEAAPAGKPAAAEDHDDEADNETAPDIDGATEAYDLAPDGEDEASELHYAARLAARRPSLDDLDAYELHDELQDGFDLDETLPAARVRPPGYESYYRLQGELHPDDPFRPQTAVSDTQVSADFAELLDELAASELAAARSQPDWSQRHWWDE